jgi:predicted transcriptional regulator
MSEALRDMPMTVALPASIGAAPSDLARAEGRSPEAVAVDAIAEHRAMPLEMRAKILRGEADIAAGRSFSHKEVRADLRGIVAAARTSEGR